MKIYYSPFKRITFLSIIFFLVTIIFYYKAPKNLVSDFLLFIVPFFYIVSILSVLFHLRVEKKNPVHFKNFHLTSIAIKLALYFIILIIYGVFKNDDVLPFFISFLVFYLIYTYLDVKSLISKFTK